MNLLFILILIILFIKLSKNKNKEIKDLSKTNEKKINIKDFQIKRINHLMELNLNFYNKKVLEIGSVNGSFAKMISKFNADITLSSAHDRKVERLKLKDNKYKVIKLDIENENDFKNLENYDYILCYDVLEHLKNPIKAITNMASITQTLIIESSFSNFFSEEIININIKLIK